MGAINDLKSRFLSTLTNLCGWKTRRRLLVIQSDDWGAIRMPSRKSWERLRASGIRVDRSRYDCLDCLECREDFHALMNVVDDHRDGNGRPAIFTFNTVMGNPDFEAIERGGFEEFHHQHVFASYRHYLGEDLEGDWGRAIRAGLIRPQFHAREHLNTPLWMRDLKAGHEDTHRAFEQRFYGLKTRTGSRHQRHYLAAYWPDSVDHQHAIAGIVEDGLAQFEKTFGFRSKTFAGCNYVWPRALEKDLVQHGVNLLQAQRGHIEPDPERGGAATIRRHYTGQKNQHGQRYSVRNVLFEPYLDWATDWADRAMSEVEQAFRLNRPAIICSHRINYVSGMDRRHRDRSLEQLSQLLTRLRRRWPEVEFVSTDELSDVMSCVK